MTTKYCLRCTPIPGISESKIVAAVQQIPTFFACYRPQPSSASRVTVWHFRTLTLAQCADRRER
jgi:hypothetical protein